MRFLFIPRPNSRAKWLRRSLLLVLVAWAASFLPFLQGCADMDTEGWQAYPAHYALTPVYRFVSGAEIQRRCPPPANAITNGCAVRADGLCYIYVEPNPPEWLKAHEEKHCAGYDHAAFRSSPQIIGRY